MNELRDEQMAERDAMDLPYFRVEHRPPKLEPFLNEMAAKGWIYQNSTGRDGWLMIFRKETTIV